MGGGGGGLEKPIYRGGLGQFVDLRGVWQERGEGVFQEVDTPMPTMWYQKWSSWTGGCLIKHLYKTTTNQT